MADEKIQEMRDKISTWLSDEGIFKDSVADDNLHFHLVAEFPARSGRFVSVIQPKGHKDMVVVFSRIKLAEMHRIALHSMPEREKARLLWEMRYSLLFQASSFDFEPRNGDLEGIRFSREMYYDGLTKNGLMEAIKENFKCELYVVWKCQEVFGGERGPGLSGPPEPMYI